MDYKFHDSKGSVKRYLGVEMEVSNIGNRDAVKAVVEKWGGEVGDDGSVRGEDTAEIRTAPARGEMFEQQIREICAVLNENGAEVNKSCGLHIHVDARDFNSEDVFKTVLVWEKFEPIMFQKVAKHRRENDYCSKLGSTLSSIVNKETQQMVKIRELADKWQYLDKHCSLNFINLEYLGTIENRMMQGTLDADKIIKWGKTNSRLIDFCKKADFNTLKELKVSSSRKLYQEL